MRRALCVIFLGLSGAATGAPPEATPQVPSVLGLRPSQASFEDVTAALGQAGVFTAGTEGEASAYRLCYVSASEGDTTSLVFQSGPQGGFGRAVTEYVLRRQLPRDIPSSRCAPSKLVAASMRLSNGLQLGLRSGEVVRRMGPPARRDGSRFVYEWRYPVVLSPDQRARLAEVSEAPVPEGSTGEGYAAIEMLFHRDNLAEIRVAHMESW